jgi:preprotein translocase subunit SecG
MHPIVTALHVLTCLLVILIVLLQSGKGAGFSGLFGGGGSDALFNAPSGSMFLRKVTMGLAIAFFTTSVILTYLGSRQRFSTLMQPMNVPFAPAAPAAAPTAPAAEPAGKPGDAKTAAPAAAPAKPAPEAPAKKK